MSYNQFAITFRLCATGLLLATASTIILPPSREALVFVAWLYLLTCSFSFVSQILDNQTGGVNFVFEFFMLFFLALPSLIQINMNVFPFYLNPHHGDLILAYSLTALAHFSYIIFQFKSARQNRNNSRKSLSLSAEHFNFFLRFGIFFGACSIFLAILVGPANLLVPRFELRNAEFGSSTQQLLFIARSLSLLTLVIFFYLLRRTRRSNKSLARSVIIFTLIYLPLFLIINYPPALPRFILFGIVIALSGIFINYFNPVYKFLLAAISVPVLFIVFPAIKSLAYGSLNMSGLTERLTSDVTNYLLRVDFDGMVRIASTVEYLREGGGIRWGENFLGVTLFFVPRSLWASKPIDSGEIVSVSLGHSYINVSSPLPAEALIGFGIAGPILVFSAISIGVRILETSVRSMEAQLQPNRVILYCLLVGFFMIIMRGSLNGVAPQFATAFLAYFVFSFLFSRRFPTRNRR